LYVEAEAERDGLVWTDPRFQVAWLRGLRRPPAAAAWPRLMSVPHPLAVGSLGPVFARWAETRLGGRRLRWWQRLAATRILEVDGEGRLVWDTAVLSTPRQVGKSWLLRELLMWRMHQGARFGEPQDVIHIGKDLMVCKEVQRQARIWAKAQPAEYRVREVNGDEQIELLEDGSRWLVKAKHAVYGYAASLAAVDEGWDVKLSVVEEGLEPTMVERTEPQLLLVSTAHRLTTSLMLSRRRLALAELETGDGPLLIEWSAPRSAPIADTGVWRASSPHWSPQREQVISRHLASALENTLDDPTEPDPIASFRSQWLNEWPPKLADGDNRTQELLPPGVWADRVEPGVSSSGPVWVAVEDDLGWGAGIAVVGRLDDGRLEIDGWTRQNWNDAIDDVQRLGRPIRELLIGASMLDSVPAGMTPRPRPAGSTQTRIGLALLRDLVVNGQLVHDETTDELDDIFAGAQVRPSPAGLQLATAKDVHLLKAAVWAIGAAHKPTPVPAIR
jgi:hypothetical protein